MGKTKTVFVGETTEQKKEKKHKADEPKKVHLAGLKGGQRIKVVEAEAPSEIASETQAEEDKKAGKIRPIKDRGKKYKEAAKKIDRGKLYSLQEAIKLVKETSYSKFDGSVELHIVTKKVGFSTSLNLPFSTGKATRIEIATETTIKKLETGKIDFDVLLATAEMMPRLVPFARILGPKGLMPNPKNGTLIKSEKEAEKFSGNALALKTEKEAPLIHIVIGKVSQKDEELVKNAESILKTLTKEKQLAKVCAKASMGPSIKIAPN